MNKPGFRSKFSTGLDFLHDPASLLFQMSSSKGALSHFRILLSILLIILNNLQVIQVLAANSLVSGFY